MTLVFPVGGRINIATAHDTSMPGQRQAKRIPLVAIATVKARQKMPQILSGHLQKWLKEGVITLTEIKECRIIKSGQHLILPNSTKTKML